MGATRTSTCTSHVSTFSNTSANILALHRSTSADASRQSDGSSDGSSSPSDNFSTCASMSTNGDNQHARHGSKQAVIKRFIFGDYNIDWKSLPAMDDDMVLNLATLVYRRDLRCKASREYYMEILNSYRVTTINQTSSTPDSNTIMIDGEEVVDMIG